MNKEISPVELTTEGYNLPVFRSVIPEAVRIGQTETAQVVIIGGGLTGLTLAADLASRGMVWSQKTLEIMDRIGVAARMIEKGVTWSVGRTLTGDQIVYEFNRSEQNVSRQPAFVNLQQFYVEWFLIERIVELHSVELRWKNKVTATSQSADAVTLTVETDDGPYTIVADWVIDASGANSSVRGAMGLNTNAARHVDRWCICDVHCLQLNVPERWTWVDAPFNGGRAVWQHMMADNVWRLDYQLDPDSDPAESADPKAAAGRVRAHLGPDISFDVVWVGPWEYRTQVLDNFRIGRMFFAGDAAHVVSPFGARGGNSGIQDAANLGWKLALVIEGKAPERLLNSYDEERRPAAHENILVTRRTSRFLAPQTPFEKRLRRSLLKLARDYPFARSWVNTGRMSQPERYSASSVVAPGAGFALPNISLQDRSGKSLGLSDAIGRVSTSIVGFYIPAGRTDRHRAAISGIGGEGAPFVVQTLDIGEGADNCALRDDARHLPGLTGAGPGDLIVVRPDLYCAAVLHAPAAMAVEQVLKSALSFAR